MTPRDCLLANNPFYSGNAGSPWDSDVPDVASINGHALLGLLRLLADKSQDPARPSAALVLGEAGVGKTHLLNRILRQTRQGEMTAVFAHVRPLVAAGSPMRYLLKELVVELGNRHAPTESLSQLDALVARLVLAYLRERTDLHSHPNFEHFEKQPLRLMKRGNVDPVWLARTQEAAMNWLDESGQIEQRDFTRALIRYRFKSTRSVARDWLRGDVLGEEECGRLGLGPRQTADNEQLEEEARYLIRSFGALLRRCRIPVVVCFDQLDSMRERRLIDAFEQMVGIMTNEVAGMLPVVFMRAQSWNDFFAKQLDPPTVGRLEHNCFTLENCSREQAEEIIRRRIEWRFGDGAAELSTWLLGRMDGRLHEGYSPRQIIQLANETINRTDAAVDLPPEDPLDILETAFGHESANIIAEFDQWPPDADRLRFALTRVLQARGFTVREVDNGGYTQLSAVPAPSGGAATPWAFFVNDRDNHLTVQAHLNRGIQLLREHPDTRCWYVADARSKFRPPPHWPTVNRTREEFESLGGRVVLLHQGQVKRWYALFSLACKVMEGDITHMGPGGRPRTATTEDLERFLQSDRFSSLIDESKPRTPPSREADVVPEPPKLDDIVEALNHNPLHLMALDQLAAELRGKQYGGTSDSLLRFLHDHRDRFQIFAHQQGVTVMLKGRR